MGKQVLTRDVWVLSYISVHDSIATCFTKCIYMSHVCAWGCINIQSTYTVMRPTVARCAIVKDKFFHRAGHKNL